MIPRGESPQTGRQPVEVRHLFILLIGWVRRCHRNASLLTPRVNAIRLPSRFIKNSRQVNVSGWLEFKIGERTKSQAEVAFSHPSDK